MLYNQIVEKMKYIEDITTRLGYKLSKKDYEIQDMGCPHSIPKSLPKDCGAVYIFVYENEFLKIGKVNTKSSNRFQYQHYDFNAAKSNLAKSICLDKKFIDIGVNKDNVKMWMLNNLHRINIYIKADKATTELVESILHYTYRPRYEGNI